tara:strand:+ start:212 stop:463 length:252 start_codon:yes stop_codon:yes gene_type:complete
MMSRKDKLNGDKRRRLVAISIANVDKQILGVGSDQINDITTVHGGTILHCQSVKQDRDIAFRLNDYFVAVLADKTTRLRRFGS